MWIGVTGSRHLHHCDRYVSATFEQQIIRPSPLLFVAFARNKRVAATFALFAVTLALLLAIVLVGLVANALQNSISLPGRSDEDKLQDKLIIAILTTGSFIVLLCIAFVILYIRTFFSPYTRPTLRYEY